MRWQIRLAEYNTKYIHIPGKENVLADGLNRIRNKSREGEVPEAGKLPEEVAAVEEQKTMAEWKEWLTDEWYSGVTYYKLFGDLEAFRKEDGIPLTMHKRRLIQMRSRSYRLIEAITVNPESVEPEGIAAKLLNRLVFVERNRKEAFCILRSAKASTRDTTLPP